jgi:hypothetical protein
VSTGRFKQPGTEGTKFQSSFLCRFVPLKEQVTFVQPALDDVIKPVKDLSKCAN